MMMVMVVMVVMLLILLGLTHARLLERVVFVRLRAGRGGVRGLV
jgi:hypothetical protein